MLFPALGMTTAIWLLTAPLLGLETGFRGEFTVAVGFVALVLAPLSMWFHRAGFALAALGILLGFANLGLSAPIGALASLATCAVGLIAAGLAPRPITMLAISASIAVPAEAATQGQRVKTPARLSAVA